MKPFPQLLARRDHPFVLSNFHLTSELRIHITPLGRCPSLLKGLYILAILIASIGETHVEGLPYIPQFSSRFASVHPEKQQEAESSLLRQLPPIVRSSEDIGRPHRESWMVSVGTLQRFGRRCDEAGCPAASDADSTAGAASLENQAQPEVDPNSADARLQVEDEAAESESQQLGPEIFLQVNMTDAGEGSSGSAESTFSELESSVTTPATSTHRPPVHLGLLREQQGQHGQQRVTQEESVASQQQQQQKQQHEKQQQQQQQQQQQHQLPQPQQQSSMHRPQHGAEPTQGQQPEQGNEGSPAPAGPDEILAPQLPVLAKLTLSDLVHRSFGTSGDESKDLSAHVSGDGAQSLVVDKEREKRASAFESGVIGFGTGVALFSSVAGALLCIAGACTLYNSRLPTGLGASDVFIAADSLPESSAQEVRQRLPEKMGYDCTFSRPISSRGLMRIRARILPPENALKAPLTGRSCVLYTASAQIRVHEGVPATPVAFHARSVGFFRVVLLGDPTLSVEVRGEDVSLFQMANGVFHKKTSLVHAPDRWYDFVRQRSTVSSAAGDAPSGAGGAGLDLSSKHRLLDFQECALLADAVVTIVGSLHRSPDGRLSVQPWHADEDDDDDAAGGDENGLCFQQGEGKKQQKTKRQNRRAAAAAGPKSLNDDVADDDSDTDLDLPGDGFEGLKVPGFMPFPEISLAANSDDEEDEHEDDEERLAHSETTSHDTTVPPPGSVSANASNSKKKEGQQRLCLAGRVFISDDPILADVEPEAGKQDAASDSQSQLQRPSSPTPAPAASLPLPLPHVLASFLPASSPPKRSASDREVGKGSSSGNVPEASFLKWPSRSFWKDVAHRTGLSRFHHR